MFCEVLHITCSTSIVLSEKRMLSFFILGERLNESYDSYECFVKWFT